MLDQSERQALLDGEHLRLLAIGYWVTAAITVFFAIYGLVYVVLGVAMAFVPEPPPSRGYSDEPSAAFMGWIFAIIGLGVMAVCAAIAALQALTGVWIRKGKHRIACMVIAGFTCLGIPYGTVLGVFTFIVLGRASVAARFANGGGHAGGLARPTGPVYAAGAAPPASQPPASQPSGPQPSGAPLAPGFGAPPQLPQAPPQTLTPPGPGEGPASPPAPQPPSG